MRLTGLDREHKQKIPKWIGKPQLRDSGVTIALLRPYRGEKPKRTLIRVKLPKGQQRDVALSVWDLWRSEHSSCRAAWWGLILLNRCGRKLGRRLVWLNCEAGAGDIIRLSGSSCGLRLIRLNRRRLGRLNSGIGRRGCLIRLDGRGRWLHVIQRNRRRLVGLN